MLWLTEKSPTVLVAVFHTPLHFFQTDRINRCLEGDCPHLMEAAYQTAHRYVRTEPR